jgi:endonuclease/exonuclease/phosphatase family metal-dependent hydrolase
VMAAGAGSRPGAGSVRFGTYNVLDLYAADSAEDLRHYELVAAVIRSLDADVLAVQEILAPDAETAARRLRQLAGDVGLRCEVPGPGGPEAAVAFGGHGYHVGLMWRDGIEAVPGSLRCYGGRDFWHGLALVTLDVGGTLIRHGAFHASPFCRRLRADQNERLVAAVTRPGGETPVLVGADWNTESADRVPPGTLYEPADPYAGVEWFADLIYQCRWDYDEQGRRRHWADREPGDVLWPGGLHDAAAAVGAAWQSTAGHHPADVYGAHGVRRRIDAVRVTGALVPALRAHQVIDTAQTRVASDHLPVVVEYGPAAAHA